MPPSQASAQSVVNKAVTAFDLGAQPVLERYLSEVLAWNPTLGLVSRKDPLAATERLLFESIEFGRTLGVQDVHRAADVGSGAGFPGVVWALLHPSLRVLLIERRDRRALFLERTCRALDIANASVVARDLRDIAGDPAVPQTLDLVASVAVGNLAMVGAEAERLLNDAGRFASTVPRRQAAPSFVGTHLQLAQRIEGKFGCYAIYRRGV
jgi:16S rRNA (guanine527-N7)-methyltransferase